MNIDYIDTKEKMDSLIELMYKHFAPHMEKQSFESDDEESLDMEEEISHINMNKSMGIFENGVCKGAILTSLESIQQYIFRCKDYRKINTEIMEPYNQHGIVGLIIEDGYQKFGSKMILKYAKEAQESNIDFFWSATLKSLGKYDFWDKHAYVLDYANKGQESEESLFIITKNQELINQYKSGKLTKNNVYHSLNF